MNRKNGTVFGLAAAALMLLGGCGEVGFKMGAGAGALDADRQACKQSDGGPAAYKACMNGKGWSIADLDAAPSSTYIPPKTAMAVAPAASAMPAPNTAGTAVTAPLSPSIAPTTTVTAPPAEPAIDPMAPVPVTAWVKFGGGDPRDGIADCVEKLGPTHEPDKAHKTVTVALLSCMRDHGWRGI